MNKTRRQCWRQFTWFLYKKKKA